MSKQTARLENWAVTGLWGAPFLKPDDVGGRLSGEAHDHPRFANGVFVHTSYIVDMDIAARFVETNNTMYTLGEPNRSYVLWCAANGVDLEKFGIPVPPTEEPVEPAEAVTAVAGAAPDASETVAVDEVKA